MHYYYNFVFYLLGWKRELVFRSVSDSGTKRNADIYYYTPKGKKVRSTREVVENCKLLYIMLLYRVYLFFVKCYC